MALQTATTGQLENAQNIVISKVRFTMEHNQPCVELVEHLNLGKGEKSLRVPKAGQATAHDLVDGVDLVDSEDIGLTTADLTTGEVGLKFYLTDKLARQENEDVFSIVGRQMGDAMGRKKNRAVIALFTALNGGTSLGLAAKSLSVTNLAACIAHAKANKYPSPVFVVHHPNAVYAITKSMTITPGSTYPIPHGYSEDLLKDFYRMSLNQVAVFETGDIDADGSGDGIGCIASKNAMCVLDQKGFGTSREYDQSLRATEVMCVADYGCWELDDTYGAPMTYDIAAPATDN